MSPTCFTVEIDNNIAVVTLNRPEKRNSMIPAFWEELPAIIEDIDDGAKARVIVIASTGPHFSAGMDLKTFGAMMGGDADRATRLTAGARFVNSVTRMQHTFSSIEHCRMPVIAAIQGGCIGAGVDLATACDLRYATDDAFLSVEETNIGMTADVGTFPRLVHLIPQGVAREMCYTGRRVSAEEASQLGLVNGLFDDHDALLAGVSKVATEIASKAPLAIQGCKRMINYSRDHAAADALDYVAAWNASMLQPEEIMEAIAARKEGRAGQFVDLPPRK